MNKTEAEYAEHLKLLLHAGEIVWFRFEGIKLKLADNCHYSPDFALVRKCGTIEIHEVKGFFTEDAKVKVKVAARDYPFKFFVVRKQTEKNGGGWEYEEF